MVATPKNDLEFPALNGTRLLGRGYYFDTTLYEEMVYCSGSNSTSYMKTKGFCFQLPLINIRRESAKMKFKSSQNLSACHLAALRERGLESCTLRCR